MMLRVQVYPGQAGAAGAGPQQMYPGSPVPPGGKVGAMPPPAPQPRRHPDFSKEQQQQQQQQQQPPQPQPYPPYPQQRPAMYGWGNSQYRGGSAGPYPGSPGGPPGPSPQQWGPGPPRPPGPPSGPAAGQWDHRGYPPSPAGGPQYQQPPQGQGQWMSNMPTPGIGQSSPLRPPMGGSPGPVMQNHVPPNAGMGPMGPNSMVPQQQQQMMPYPHPQLGGKRDHLSFPHDSVEATMPVLYKRRRMARTDVSPVEAWRIMMSLRSGLLAESCWALDVLNVLLFDDASVAYFGLGNLPGLLDVLLEHFRRSLADMYETSVRRTTEVDLGCPRNINPSDRSQILSSAVENYTSVTRRGEKVTIVPRDSDPFVDDSKREWDETEPWDDPLALLLMAPPGAGTVVGAETDSGWPSMSGASGDSMKYIVPCFRAEFGTIPFVRLLPEKEETEGEENEVVTEERPVSSPSPPPPTLQLAVIKEEPKEEEVKPPSIPERKNCDKKKRVKSLSDVLSRIKKEPVEDTGDLAKEIRQKLGKKEEEEMPQQPPVLEPVPEIVKVPTPEPPVVAPVTTNGEVSEEETEMKVDDESPKPETPPEPEDDKRPKLLVKDPAGTLRRKRLEDYEDESYARDEASLCLINETQEGVARRCLCVANILRSLTFIPGNELEFAKNTAFLSLLGKLIVLHHEHPVRAMKQRNYDRDEEAAECAEASCSSLAGDSEWWWEHLHILRESVLVMTANISGQLDLGQHPEEVSRPILDGLLHWAVCPAAYGQDPFPSASSLLSPQRLALEALCKLCVTDSNVDLLLATPPHSRLERLCATLARLLCRSEEQPLREFAVNLLHSLAAAASSAARVVAMQAPTVSLLLGFIEQAEQAALAVANQHGIQALRDNPDSMGTSLDMLRRAAGTLLHLSRHRANRPLFLQQEHRLLALVMSQILDQHVAAILSRVLYQCSRVESTES
ncbi:UNVERIFIED_CONTAM: hypothetical protein B566_EDAN016692 [Ephemera danica]|nr:hypothetical protein B566_EDAN016692 [Ephemera danica]